MSVSTPALPYLTNKSKKKYAGEHNSRNKREK